MAFQTAQSNSLLYKGRMFVHIQYKSHKCQSGASRHKQDSVKKNRKVSQKQKQLKQQLQTG